MQNSCRDPYPYLSEMESGNQLHKSRDNADVKRIFVAAVLPGEIHFETEQNQITRCNCCDEPMVATKVAGRIHMR